MRAGIPQQTWEWRPERSRLMSVATLSGDSANESLIALDLALQKLETIDEAQSKIVELRYFGV